MLAPTIGPRPSARKDTDRATYLVGGVKAGSVDARTFVLGKAEHAALEKMLASFFSGKVRDVVHPKDALSHCTVFYNSYFVESVVHSRPNYFKLTGLVPVRAGPASDESARFPVSLVRLSLCQY